MNNKDEALKAMLELNNKPLRGRRILVTRANESQYQEHQAAHQGRPGHQHRGSSSGGPDNRTGARARVAPSDPTRPTTLSILKSQQQPKGVNNKIAALEAKLASMQQSHNGLASGSGRPVASGSVTLDKPPSLPLNPLLLKQNQSHSAKPPNPPNTWSRGAGHSVKPTKVETISQATKNSDTLETVGLTLKEHLKRNREHHVQVPAVKTSVEGLNPNNAPCHSAHAASSQSGVLQDENDLRDGELTTGSNTNESDPVQCSKRPKCDESTQNSRVEDQLRDDGSRSRDITRQVKPDLNKISWSARKKV